MDSLSICLSLSSPPFQKPHKSYPKPIFFLPSYTSSTCCQPHFSFAKKTNPFHQLSRISTTLTPSIKNLPISLKAHLSLLSLGFSFPFPSYATETTLPIDQESNKINIEAIVVSIDNFFNRYPFFVAGVTFIWLVVIPLTEEYLAKVKFISAIDAFRKLRDDPTVQLLDIREQKNLRRLRSPNLKYLNKSVVQVEYSDEDEEGFVKKVLDNFKEPQNTTICILDYVDDNTLKVAELLFKNGFREAYAIRGGVRGKDGWLAIQETLLPPPVHIRPRRGRKKTQSLETNGGVNVQSENADRSSSMSASRKLDNGFISQAVEPTAQTNTCTRPLSPYTMYPDMKPPSSPTPSKPKS